MRTGFMVLGERWRGLFVNDLVQGWRCLAWMCVDCGDGSGAVNAVEWTV